MASSKPVWQTVSIKPFTGIFDSRSDTADVALGSFRWKQNFQLTGGDKLATRAGHDKLLASATPYVNQDWHDKSDNNGIVASQPPTLLFPSEDNFGNRLLYAATQERIAFLNESTGLWTTVARGMGGALQTGLPATRFRAAELQDQILFTNNVDQPVLSAIGSDSSGPIGDLGTLNVTAGAITIQFAGFLFLMDVFQDGIRQSARVRWSDLDSPSTWLPAPTPNPITLATSLAGFQDLDYGSQILGAAIMANSLYIFTTTAIWVCFPSGANLGATVNPATFGFTRIYSEQKNGAKCIRYPNTLVSEGNEVYYGASDGIYRFDPYIPEPVREEWLYKATSVAYNDNLNALDPTCCQSPCAEIFPDDEEVFFSFPESTAQPAGSCLNTKTIVFNYHYHSVDIVDTGFSAFCNYEPAQSDPESCPPSSLFIGASMADYCLKQIGGIFSRNVCTNALTATGNISGGVFTPFSGQYTYVGYYRILRFLLPLQNLDREKWIRHLLIESTAQPQATPCIVQCRIGTSYSQSDPNLPDGLCSIIWSKLPDLPLKCAASMTGSQYAKANLMPNKAALEWNTLRRGRFIFVEFRVANADGSPAIGGNAIFPRCETQIRLAPS